MDLLCPGKYLSAGGSEEADTFEATGKVLRPVHAPAVCDPFVFDPAGVGGFVRRNEHAPDRRETRALTKRQ
jgi:hypothetical protein